MRLALFALIAPLAVDMNGTAAAADIEYGQYLSSECVTCHQTEERAGAGDAKIPVIAGMDEESFVGVMKLYREGEMTNETMRTVAARLTDEDIAALAAYFASLARPGGDG